MLTYLTQIFQIGMVSQTRCTAALLLSCIARNSLPFLLSRSISCHPCAGDVLQCRLIFWRPVGLGRFFCHRHEVNVCVRHLILRKPVEVGRFIRYEIGGDVLGCHLVFLRIFRVVVNGECACLLFMRGLHNPPTFDVAWQVWGGGEFWGQP